MLDKFQIAHIGTRPTAFRIQHREPLPRQLSVSSPYNGTGVAKIK
jgi:hypothetical protein